VAPQRRTQTFWRPCASACPAVPSPSQPCPIVSPSFGRGVLQGAIKRCITDASHSADATLSERHGALATDQVDQVLALRGLLACDLLCHCLQKRHNVDYGIARWAPCMAMRLLRWYLLLA
jgi:hypothetical protein